MEELPHESPPPDGDVSLQSQALIAIWVLFGATSVVMILRLFAQVKVLRRPGLDDALMILAWICQAINCSLNTASIWWGIGRHAYYLTQEQYSLALKYIILAIPWGAVCSMLGRISFIVFLLIFIMTISRARKYLLWALIVSQFIFNVIPIIVIFMQCHPASHLWDPWNSGSCSHSTVVNTLGYLQGAVNASTDLCLTVIGITLVVSLNLRLGTKISLSALLSLSMLAMIAAILKTIKLKDTAYRDRTYYFGVWSIWYMTENAIVIITASVPKIRPLVVIIRQKHAESKYRRRRRANDDLESATPVSKYLDSWSRSGWRVKDTLPSSLNNDSVTRYHSSFTGTTATTNNGRGRCWSIYNTPRRRGHRSENISLTSLPRPSTTIPWTLNTLSQHSSDLNLSTMTSHDFIPPLSPCLTSRTVISGGGPIPSSVPASVLSSGVPSARASQRNSLQENVRRPSPSSISPPTLIPVNIGGRQNMASPLMASGPYCIWQTRDFVVEYEDVAANTNNPQHTGAGLGLDPLNPNPNHYNDHSGHNNQHHRYDESEAEGLKLYDVGSILKP